MNRLTPRDVKILEKLVECRLMTSTMIFDLFFPGPSASRGRERLRFLLDMKLVRRIEMPTLFSEGRKPYAYAPRGLDHIVDAGQMVIDKKPLNATSPILAHILQCSEVNVQFSKVINRHDGYSLDAWLNDLTLNRKEMVDWFEIDGQRASLVPDAFFTITTPERPYNFMLEVDRSKETARDISAKMTKYRYYFQLGLYEKRYRTDKGRVLFVCQSMQRLRNIKEVIESNGGRARYWLAVASDLQTHDPLHSPIWYKAGAQETFRLL